MSHVSHSCNYCCTSLTAKSLNSRRHIPQGHRDSADEDDRDTLSKLPHHTFSDFTLLSQNCSNLSLKQGTPIMSSELCPLVAVDLLCITGRFCQTSVFNCKSILWNTMSQANSLLPDQTTP